MSINSNAQSAGHAFVSLISTGLRKPLVLLVVNQASEGRIYMTSYGKNRYCKSYPALFKKSKDSYFC
jgi:hypothetical protein